jgi:hypothetical protein
MDNKKLIKQYLNTGAKLTSYQLGDLSANERKTYIKRRLTQHYHSVESYLTNEEFQYLSPKEKSEIVEYCFKNGTGTVYMVENLEDNKIEEFITFNGVFNKDSFHALSDEHKRVYARKKMEHNMVSLPWVFNHLTTEEQVDIIVKNINKNKVSRYRLVLDNMQREDRLNLMEGIAKIREIPGQLMSMVLNFKEQCDLFKRLFVDNDVKFYKDYIKSFRAVLGVEELQDTYIEKCIEFNACLTDIEWLSDKAKAAIRDSGVCVD